DTPEMDDAGAFVRAARDDGAKIAPKSRAAPKDGPGSTMRCGVVSARPDAPVVHPHVGPFADPADVALAQGHRVAVVHAHIDVVALRLVLHVLLDRMARECACRGARDGGGVLLALARILRQFMAGDRADDTAEHR